MYENRLTANEYVAFFEKFLEKKMIKNVPTLRKTLQRSFSKIYFEKSSTSVLELVRYR